MTVYAIGSLSLPALEGLQQYLDLEFSEGDYIAIRNGVVHIGAQALAVDKGPIGGAQVHEEDAACLALEHGVQARDAARIGLVRRLVDVRYDRLSLADAAQCKLVALRKGQYLPGVEQMESHPIVQCRRGSGYRAGPRAQAFAHLIGLDVLRGQRVGPAKPRSAFAAKERAGHIHMIAVRADDHRYFSAATPMRARVPYLISLPPSLLRACIFCVCSASRRAVLARSFSPCVRSSAARLLRWRVAASYSSAS